MNCNHITYRYIEFSFDLPIHLSSLLPSPHCFAHSILYFRCYIIFFRLCGQIKNNPNLNLLDIDNNYTSGGGDLRLGFWAAQIKHSVASSLTILRNCVARCQATEMDWPHTLYTLWRIIASMMKVWFVFKCSRSAECLILVLSSLATRR